MQYKYIYAYLRLSDDDADKNDESNSIKNQKLLIEYFVGNHDELKEAEIVFFIDDGFTGTNFNRPDFKKMMEKVKHAGKDCCIIVKDLSRLGRDTIETQNYIEKVFPFLQIRFIAINDYYDSSTSIKDGKETEAKFKNLINGIYPEICSKNVKQALRKINKTGAYIGAVPPYGYMFAPNTKRSLVLDQEAALIVRYIFDRRLAGTTYCDIARELDSKGIKTPCAYLTEKGFRCRRANDIQAQWTDTSIKKILNNPVYIGAVVNHKTELITVNGKAKTVPKEEQIYVEDMHEAIVTKEEFEKVAAMVKHSIQKARIKSKERCVFAGKIRCGYCHRVVRIRTEYKEPKIRCRSITARGKGCFDGQYRVKIVEDMLLNLIRQEAANADITLKQIKEMNKTLDITKLKRKRGAYEGKLKKCWQEKKELYEKYALGGLSKESYLEQKQEIAQKEQRYKTQVSDLQKEIEDTEAKKERENSSKLAAFIKYKDLEGLSYAIVQELVDTIYFYSPERIEVIWNFKDDYLERCAG